MPSRCIVGGCSKTTDAKKGIKLHRIPYFGDNRQIAKARRKQWTDFVSRRRQKWTPSATSAICSCHFKAEDYSQQYSFGKERHLAHLIRDEIGIVPIPSIQIVENGDPQNTRENVNEKRLSSRSRRSILREAMASKCTSPPASELESVPLDNVIELIEADEGFELSLPTDVNDFEESGPRDFSTQTKGCVGCDELARENRRLRNRCIDLRNRSTINELKKNCPKISCGVQCDLNYNPSPDSLEEFEENVSEDGVEDVDMEQEPGSPCDSNYHPDTESEAESEPEIEGKQNFTKKRLNLDNSNNIRTEPKHIVFLSKILLLFSFCHSCKEPNPDVQAHECGTMLEVTTTCNNPKCPEKTKVWKSQPNIPGTRTPAGNFLLCFAILLAGGSASKVFQIFAHMGLACISLRNFFKHQRNKLFPTIYLHWKSYQAAMFEKVKAIEEPLTISGDGRHDSMGHSAKFGAYTIFCCSLPLIIHFALVQRNEAGSSNAMEVVGFQRCMEYLIGSGLLISTFISDRHPSISKHMREKINNITHYFDLWHLKKSIRKSLIKIAKESGCEALNEWIKPCLNHLHWSATSTICGTGQIIWAKFNSFKSHIVNKHADLPDPLFNKCAHGSDIKPRKWLHQESLLYEKVEKALTNNRLVAGIQQASPLDQTSCLEGFHSLLNHFCPKMIAFSFSGMFCRHILAAIHYNYNLVREVKKKTDGSEQLRFIYPKFKNGEASVRHVRIKPNFDYVEEIFVTFLEASKDKALLVNASKELEEMSPPPMNTMLEKQSKTDALEKKRKRESMIVKNVPPTLPLSEVVTQEAPRSNKQKKAPHCKQCNQPMKGHSKVQHCPRNNIQRSQ